MSTTTLIILIAAVVALVLAIILTRALTRSSLLADRARLESILDVPARIEKAVQDTEKAKDAVMAAHDKAHADALAARDQAHETAMRTMKEQFAETMEQMKEQVKNATDELLKARQKEFKESSSEALGTLLSPVKEKMEELTRR